MAVELPELFVRNATEWRAWLEVNHAEKPGVWLVLHKKGGQVTELACEDAVLEALCSGWIDEQQRSRDAGSSALRFTPRTKRSRWSRSNVARVSRLEAEGRITPAGHAAVNAAKAGQARVRSAIADQRATIDA